MLSSLETHGFESTSKAMGKGVPRFMTATLSDEEVSSTNQDEQKTRRSGPVMSQAIPFLACPPVLADSDLAGNVGFDPLSLSSTKERLLQYREAEVKHGRLAMLVSTIVVQYYNVFAFFLKTKCVIGCLRMAIV